MLFRRPLASLLRVYQDAPVLWRNALPVVLVVFVAWLDFSTPPYIFLIGFYFLPIYLATWYGSATVTSVVLGISLATSLYMTSQNIPSAESLWSSALAYLSVALVFIGFVWVMTILRNSFAQLQAENQTDALTGVRSRRAFLEMINFEISRATRSGESITLAIIDIDNFKHVNDTQGHAAGDALLVAASRCMTAALREIDIVGRLGGDEFAVLLPGAAVPEARRALDRLHSQLNVLLETFSPLVTTSVGAVSLSPGMRASVTEIIEKADAAMYSVKNSSKDGVRVRAFASDVDHKPVTATKVSPIRESGQ